MSATDHKGATAKPDRKRLHITPFNPDLLDRFIPPSLRPEASNISFHAVQTYPERGFGYVELPAMEADRLKKKLNGSVLKGTKVKIEEAKPEKKRKVQSEESEDEDERAARKKAKKEKRKKREEGVISGHQLEEGRRIKRGWKEDEKDKRSKKKKSKKGEDDGDNTESLEGKKLRFKTSIPPNLTPVEDKSKKKSKDKKEKKVKNATVVEEFKKSHKPTNAGAPSKKHHAAQFEEGKGWVDEEGNVIEPAPVSKRPKKAKRDSPAEASKTVNDQVMDQEAPAHETSPNNAASSSNASSLSDDESSVLSESSVVSESEGDAQSSPATPPPAKGAAASTETQDLGPKEVHPLEALFKRPAAPDSASKPKPQPIDTSFSFFQSGDIEEDEDEPMGDAVLPPQTPHTKQDMEWRGTRSAAPTPDTAAIGKKFSFPFAHDDDEDEHDEDGVDDSMADVGPAVESAEDGHRVPSQGSTQLADREESEFRKWFFENRGDLNRGWKKRRREERKAKRQRENRRLSRRVV
ncbi:hypothetical protein D0869_07872 [Hortaea werneckii]|uniref:RRM domain-containing protein n=1 Tax=Hortaea werneckii TaxID=91943 RepID=A0A3M6WN49_HORWE|nr:hypothetical protein D0869_07872 [Hortaea werneckii]